ncbi:unnamed protein product [Moneuplotes crassus]|uniref:Uncharacterized protein n=1 Tax=Euplotes crassus TaxID=5936 RepID=A0AAD1XG22_EUPCR|nr:unnamed protein product [Moneuplotes crassus]
MKSVHEEEKVLYSEQAPNAPCLKGRKVNLKKTKNHVPKFYNNSTKSCGSISTETTLAQAFEYEFLTQYDLESSSYGSSKKIQEISNEDLSNVDDKSEKSLGDTITDDYQAYIGRKVNSSKIISTLMVTPNEKTSHSTKCMPILNTLFTSSKEDDSHI